MGLKNTLRYDNTMETRLKIAIALCIVILCATLVVILISIIRKRNHFSYSIDDLTHDKHDTTDEQRKIHRRAAESEYWERKNIDSGIYG